MTPNYFCKVDRRIASYNQGNLYNIPRTIPPVVLPHCPSVLGIIPPTFTILPTILRIYHAPGTKVAITAIENPLISDSDTPSTPAADVAIGAYVSHITWFSAVDSIVVASTAKRPGSIGEKCEFRDNCTVCTLHRRTGAWGREGVLRAR